MGLLTDTLGFVFFGLAGLGIGVLVAPGNGAAQIATIALCEAIWAIGRGAYARTQRGVIHRFSQLYLDANRWEEPWPVRDASRVVAWIVERKEHKEEMR